MTTTKTIRLMLVEDHDILRGGLATFLQSLDDLELVGEAATGIEAISQCGKLRPDVILMDVRMPDMDGMTATQIIREKYPETRVIILTTYMDEELIQEAIQLGVTGYLLKNVSVDQLAEAIRAAYEGKQTLSPEVNQVLTGVPHRSIGTSYNLTSREREVLKFMVKGLSDSEIAYQLVISQAMVKKCIEGIMAKLSTNTRAETMDLAVQHNLFAR
jgi:two-component system, NarL family, response regulator LiaR